MKILFILPNLQCGGAETFVINLVNYFNRNTLHDANLLNLNLYNYINNNPLESRIVPFNKNYYKINQYSILNLFQKYRIIRKIYKLLFLWLYELFQIFSAKAIIKSIQPDIICSNIYSADRIISKCNKDIPHVIVDHGEYKLFTKSKSKLIQQSGCFICVSYSNKLLVLNHTYIENINVIHNGFEAPSNFNSGNEFSRDLFNISIDAFVFVMTGRGIKEKGWIEAVKAFEEFNKLYLNSYFLLVGKGLAIDLVSDYISSNNIKNIILLGFKENVFGILKMCNVSLLPSYFANESLPLSLIESLFAGLPIIATNVGGIPEIVVNKKGNCGILIELKSGKPEIIDIFKAMKEMYINYDYFESNIEHCKINFSMQKCCNEYAELFTKILN